MSDAQINDFQSQFTHVQPITVVWGDMDSMRHVNNTVYFHWMETARIEYLSRHELLVANGTPGVGPILAFTTCQFHVPVVYPDTVYVGSRIEAIGNTSIKMEQAIYSADQQRVVAAGKSVIVLVDYRTGEKVRVPDSVREVLGKGSLN